MCEVPPPQVDGGPPTQIQESEKWWLYHLWWTRAWYVFLRRCFFCDICDDSGEDNDEFKVFWPCQARALHCMWIIKLKRQHLYLKSNEGWQWWLRVYCCGWHDDKSEWRLHVYCIGLQSLESNDVEWESEDRRVHSKAFKAREHSAF